KSAQIREILISESAWEEMTCLFAPSTVSAVRARAFILFLNTGTYNPTWGKTLINPLSRCELAGCFDFQ
ncbi:hypothetical protein R1M29_24805, partial [Klebsiella sp. 91194]